MDKKIIKCVFLLFLIFTLSFTNTQSKENNKNVFKKILDKTQSQFVEEGIKITFGTKENSEKICLNLLSLLDKNLGENISNTILKDQDVYTVEFIKSEITGYIESFYNGEDNIVTLVIVSKRKNYNIDIISSELNNFCGNISRKTKCYSYIKAELRNNSIDKAKNETTNLLREEGASNINTLKIENGYSLVANTNEFVPIKNNGKFIDLNCSFSSYVNGDKESKSYVIVGTPIIFALY